MYYINKVSYFYSTYTCNGGMGGLQSYIVSFFNVLDLNP